MSFVQLQIEPDLLLITQLEYGVKNYNDKNYLLLLSLRCQQPIQSIHQSSKPWILHREKYPQHFKIKTWTSSIQLFKWSSAWNRIKMNLMDTNHPLSIAVLCLPKFVFFLHNKMYTVYSSSLQVARPNLFLDVIAKEKIENESKC